MVKIIYPASDAIFYITTREPKTEAEWGELQGKALARGGVGEPADDAGARARSGSLDAGREADARRRRAPRSARRRPRTSPRSTRSTISSTRRARAVTRTTDRTTAAGRRQALPRHPNNRHRPPLLPLPPLPPLQPLPPLRPSRQPTLEGRWKLRAAEDVRADGTVARLPWGEHPVGSIVVERGACYVQIMSSDTPSFTPGTRPSPSR